MIASIACIIGALAIAGADFGDGLGGQRLEKVVGGLIVDVGTDQTSTPLAGTPIEFDFGLLQSDTRDPVENTSVGVDISRNGKMMVNCDLITDPQTTFLFYTFPEAGNYTLKVTFFDRDRQVATASFPLAISGSSGKTRALYVGALLACLLLGAAGGYWGVRRREANRVAV